MSALTIYLIFSYLVMFPIMIGDKSPLLIRFAVALFSPIMFPLTVGAFLKDHIATWVEKYKNEL